MSNTKMANISVEGTRFIFATNFSGDPSRDAFGSEARKANIILPEDLAFELKEQGFNVKQTKPREGEEAGFEPTYFVAVKANYDSEWPPKIYLVPSGFGSDSNKPILLDANSVGRLDLIYVKSVDVVLNPYYSERNRTWSLYIRSMYVVQDMDDDPFAGKYWSSNDFFEEECPFT